jgi:hypothetical protein
MTKRPIIFNLVGVNYASIPTEEATWTSLELITEVPSDEAEVWFGALEHLTENLNLHFSQISRNTASGNAGVFEISRTSALSDFQFVWRKNRNEPLLLYMLSAPSTVPEGLDIKAILGSIDVKSVPQHRVAAHRNGQVEFNGKKWDGEYWLDNNIRLGPPSIQFEDAIEEPDTLYSNGPRIVMVDALMPSFGQIDWSSRFKVLCEEIALFLTIVTGQLFNVPKQELKWLLPLPVRSTTTIAGWTGYFDPTPANVMPDRGSDKPLPTYDATRPDLTPLTSEYPPGNTTSLPADTSVLWASFRSLDERKRTQFKRSAAKFQEALYVWNLRISLSFALCIVACEALKPSGKVADKENARDVIKRYLGDKIAAELDQLFEVSTLMSATKATQVRNKHLHRGELFGDEFRARLATQSFSDPTFSMAERQMRLITQAVLIEWLRLAKNDTP